MAQGANTICGLVCLNVRVCVVMPNLSDKTSHGVILRLTCTVPLSSPASRPKVNWLERTLLKKFLLLFFTFEYLLYKVSKRSTVTPSAAKTGESANGWIAPLKGGP